MKKKEEVGDPSFSWGEAEGGHPPIDIVRLGDTIGVRYGQISLVFREGEDCVPKANE